MSNKYPIVLMFRKKEIEAGGDNIKKRDNYITDTKEDPRRIRKDDGKRWGLDSTSKSPDVDQQLTIVGPPRITARRGSTIRAERKDRIRVVICRQASASQLFVRLL